MKYDNEIDWGSFSPNIQGKGKKLVRAQLGLFDGVGATKTAAKVALFKDIKKCCEDAGCPYIIRDGQWAILIFRDMRQWYYQFIEYPDLGPQSGIFSGSGSGGSFKEIYNKAAFHLAQNAWGRQQGEAIPGYVRNEDDRKELAGYFQRRLEEEEEEEEKESK